MTHEAKFTSKTTTGDISHMYVMLDQEVVYTHQRILTKIEGAEGYAGFQTMYAWGGLVIIYREVVMMEATLMGVVSCVRELRDWKK